MDKNKDFLHDLWYVSGVNEDIWSTLIDNYNNATEKDQALAHIKWHLGYKQDDGKLKEIEEKIDSSTQVKLTFTANADTTVDVYFTKESFDSKKPDDTISLTANQEKTTTYDRESIYKFNVMYTSNPSRPWESAKNYNIEYSKIEGKLLDCSNLFKKCSALTTLDFSHFDTSKVTDMDYMFDSCSALTSLDVTNFDTSKVTNMGSMFNNCSALTSLDVTNFDTSKVTNMSEMFSNCSALTSLDVTNFDTSKVTNMNGMFMKCSALTSLDVTNFDTSKVTNMGSMFMNCSALTSLDVTNFDTSNVTNMREMFNRCISLSVLDVSHFNTCNVIHMNLMFFGCSNLNTIGSVNTASGWQHKPDEYYDMFTNCPATPKPTWYT